jgi:hypothetical protein
MKGSILKKSVPSTGMLQKASAGGISSLKIDHHWTSKQVVV